MKPHPNRPPFAAPFAGAVLALLVAQPPAARAQAAYPSQPLHFVVATAPGGGLDTFARILARALTPRAGQQVVVENRPGAGTTIATAAVARAKPDGHAVLLNTSAFAISPATYRKISYDPLRDFVPVTLAVSTPNLLVVHPSLPATSVRELIMLARKSAAKGEPILYASGGNGTNGHLAAALFLDMAGIQMTHVPYKSGSLGVVDLIAGQVAMMNDSLSSVIAHVRSGKLRALGVSSTQRAPAAPDIPTVAEAGVPGYESGQWYGLFVPTGTPTNNVNWLHRETASALRAPAVQSQFADIGLDVNATSPAHFATRVKSDIAKWRKLVKASGMPLL